MKRFFSEVPMLSKSRTQISLMRNMQKMQIRYTEQKQIIDNLPSDKKPQPVSNESLDNLQDRIEETRKHSVY